MKIPRTRQVNTYWQSILNAVSSRMAMLQVYRPLLNQLVNKLSKLLKSKYIVLTKLKRQEILSEARISKRLTKVSSTVVQSLQRHLALLHKTTEGPAGIRLTQQTWTSINFRKKLHLQAAREAQFANKTAKRLILAVALTMHQTL